MRTSTILVTLLLCLNLSSMAEGQILSKKVTLEYRNQTLGQILNQISRKYQISFSYSDNMVPLNRKTSVAVKNQTLNEALNQLFKGTDVGFEEQGSQVVLKKLPAKSGSKAGTFVPASQTSATAKRSTAAASASLIKTPLLAEPQYRKILRTDSLSQDKLRRQFLEEKSKLRTDYYTKLDSLEKTGNRFAVEELKAQFNRIFSSLKQEIKTISDSLNTEKLRHIQLPKLPESKVKSPDSSGYFYSPAQATFINPIGTNGPQSDRTVNGVSLNFAGHAAGLEGFELGLLLNSEQDFVHGVQFCGLGNMVRGSVTGGQFSGLFNINKGNTRGGQFSGFTNMVAADANAIQAAGFMNLVTGNFRGGQAAGFLNYTSGNVDGAQIAGFLNTAADTLTGAQIAGFLNVANTVQGSQIGFLNVADTVTGVQFGFLSFSKRGYRRLELSGGETFQGNVAFKTGTRNFYNILAAGAQAKDQNITWGYGYGFGSELPLSRKLQLSLDVLGYQLHRDGFQGDELNLLCQFKPTLGVSLAKKASLFAGPSFNVMVSNTDRYRNPDLPLSGSSPSTLAPDWYFFSDTNSGTNVTMWLGFTGGIRF
jgi:hypothetical protein